MLNVIKPGGAAFSGEVVRIPDLPPRPVAAAPGQEAGPLVRPDLLEAEQAFIERAVKTAEARAQEVAAQAEQNRARILSQAGAEAEELRRQARQQGYSDGYHEMCGQISGCIAQVGETLDRMQAQQQAFIRQYEESLKTLAVDIAEKILNKRIAADGADLVELVRQAVSSIKNADWIEVEVSDKLPALVERLKTEFAAQAAGGAQVDVLMRDLPPGGCVVHTPEAIVDASVPVQLENLRELLAEVE